MGCKPFKTAEANAKKWLLDKGAIDKFLNIKNNARFDRLNKELTEHGKKAYNLVETFFYKEDVIGTNKAVPNKEAFKKVDKINGVYYNLNDVDVKRRKVNRALEILLRKTLSTISYEKSNGTYGPIEFTTIEKYRRFHKTKYGKDIDQLGIANLMDGIIAVAENRDGITLPEEALHFIIHLMEGTQALDDLLATDIEDTQIYTDNFDQYYSMYNGDIDMVRKEILAKIISQYMYDKYQTKTLGNRILTALEKFINIFFKGIKISRKLDTTKYNANLLSELEKFVESVETGTISLPNYYATNVTQINVLERSIDEEKVRESYKRLYDRLVLLQETVYGLFGNMKDEYMLLETQFGTSNKVYVQNEINFLRGLTRPLSAIEVQRLEDLTKFLDLIVTDERDKSTIKRIQKILVRVKEIKENINARKFQGGILIFFFGPAGDNGAIHDIRELIATKDAIEAGTLEYDIHMYKALEETIDLYAPVIVSLNKYYKQGLTFNELSTAENDLLREAINEAAENLDTLKVFQQVNATPILNKYFIQNGLDTIMDVDSSERIFADASSIDLWLGSGQNLQDGTGRYFHSLVVKTSNKIHRAATNAMIDLINSLKKKDYTAKDMRKIQEYHKGRKSGYYLNPFNIGQYLEAEEAAIEEAIVKAENLSTVGGKKIIIPRTDIEKRAYFTGANLYGNSPEIIAEKERREAQYTLYKKELRKWYKTNSQPISNLNSIIATRQKELNATQYLAWKNKNIIELEDGSILYVGELIKPADKYANPEYENLRGSDPDLFDLLQKLHMQTFKQLRRLPLTDYSYAQNHQLVQISKSNMDISTSGNKWANIKEKMSETVTSRVDDDIYANRIDNTLIKRPPIRYLKKLENPDFLTDDLILSVARFTEMVEAFNQYKEVLPELQGMVNVIENSNVKSGKTIIKGEESNLKAKLEDILNRYVYGEAEEKVQFQLNNGKVVDVSKLSSRLYKYGVDLNLLGNIPAVITGWITSGQEALIEATIAKYGDKKDFSKSFEEYVGSLGAMISDYENPIKTHKITVAMQGLGIIDGVAEYFSDTEKNKVYRSAASMANYGLWRATDHSLKGVTMISVANSIKWDGTSWVTKSKYQGLDWANLETLWDKVKVTDSKLDTTGIPKEIIDLWVTRAKTISSRLDKTLSHHDKAKANTHIFFRYFLMHMGWLQQTLYRVSHGKQYNFLTEEYEEGYWRTILSNSLYFELFNPSFVPENMLEAEAVARVRYTVLAAGISYMLAYILNAIALDDDDEENYFVQMAAYISTRVFMEKASEISAQELYEYISSPKAGLDKINLLGSPIAFLFSYLNGLFGEEKDIQSGMYKGYSPAGKALAKSIPLYRGLFETTYGGYVNEMLGKPSTHVGVSLEGKNRFMKSKVNGLKLMNWFPPIIPVLKTVGGVLAMPIASIFSSKPKSHHYYDLPSASANKEEKPKKKKKNKN